MTRVRDQRETTTLTYPDVADYLRVRVCMDPLSRCNLLAPEQHRQGFVDWRNGVPLIHFRDRNMTRRGLWNFLKLVARVVAPSGTYERVWFEAQAAYDLGLSLGVRFPREYASTDRARVRAALAAVPGGFGESRAKMERWAREAPG